MIIYLIFQALLVGFNNLNVKHDAYRILKDKRIAHGINFVVYGLICALLIWLAQRYFNIGWVNWILFAISAFFNRQLSFDIPLNLRRGLKWYYQSIADPPKSITDQFEKWIYKQLKKVFKKLKYTESFGKWLAGIYAICWIICLVIKIFI